MLILFGLKFVTTSGCSGKSVVSRGNPPAWAVAPSGDHSPTPCTHRSELKFRVVVVAVFLPRTHRLRLCARSDCRIRRRSNTGAAKPDFILTLDLCGSIKR